MSCGLRSDGWADTSTRAADVEGEISQPASSGNIKSKADTSEWSSWRADPRNKERRKRANFPRWKVQELNNAFQHNAYLRGPGRFKLADNLGMTEDQVQIWFQNKRVKLKKQALLNIASNRAEYMGAMNSSRAVSQDLRAKQQMFPVSWPEAGVRQRYTLRTDREVVSSTIAKSPVDAVQTMLVEIEGALQKRSSCSATDCRQSSCPEPELPVTTSTSQLTKVYDVPDSSNSIGL